MSDPTEHSPDSPAVVERRSVWSAIWIGAAIGAIPLVAVIVLLLSTSVPGGYAGVAVGAGMFYLALFALGAIVLGALVGAMFLRTRRSWIATFGIVTAGVVALTVIGYGAGTAYASAGRWIEARRQAQTEAILLEHIVVNQSSKMLADVKWACEHAPCGVIGHHDFRPYDVEALARASSWGVAERLPAWKPGMRVSVEWTRPAHGDEFTASELDASTQAVRLHADVPLERYTGTINKTMVTTILPNDMVSIRVVDRAVVQQSSSLAPGSLP